METFIFVNYFVFFNGRKMYMKLSKLRNKKLQQSKLQKWHKLCVDAQK